MMSQVPDGHDKHDEFDEEKNRGRSTLPADLCSPPARLCRRTTSEERDTVFMNIGKVSLKFLLLYQSACESVRSVSVGCAAAVLVANPSTAPGKSPKIAVEFEPLTTSGPLLASSQDAYWDDVSWRLEFYFSSLLEWQAKLSLARWPRRFEETDDLVGVGARICSSLICLAENEINQINPVICKIVRQLESLVGKGKELRLSSHTSETEFSETTGIPLATTNTDESDLRLRNLDAIHNCIKYLERLLRVAEKALASRGRFQSSLNNGSRRLPRTKQVPHLISSGMRKSRLSGGQSIVSGFKRAHFDEQEEMEKFSRQRIKRQTSSTSATREKDSLWENGSSRIYQRSLFERLKKLSILHGLWENSRSDQNMDSSTAVTPRYVTVFISTEVRSVTQFILDGFKLKKDEPMRDSSMGDIVDTMSERFSKCQLVDDNFPDSVAWDLLNHMCDEYRLILKKEKTPDLFPGFLDAYTVMESSLAFLESLLNWRIHARMDYDSLARAQLPIIQRCLLDRLLEALSKLPTQLKNAGPCMTLEPDEVRCAVKTLDQFIQRVTSIEIGRFFGTEWKRLQQPLEEVLMELNELSDDLVRKAPLRIGENGERDVLSVPDLISLPPLHLLFHFTHEWEQLDMSWRDPVNLLNFFVSELASKFMLTNAQVERRDGLAETLKIDQDDETSI
ncbi:hypothetical protein NUW58_g4060 [Xylaria curta]|uniref:Uncharacterized protein n=1 Tax=Xylaria curta TaxID=42375 RepID=A0ACC1P824_9PEZI|nr:hypothetical protein NUW58_g4060 [Xylaria curta]